MLHRYRSAFMQGADAAPAGSAAPAPAAPAPAAPAAPAAGEEWRQMSNEAFNQRLADAGKSREAALLKEFGVKTPADLKSLLDEGKKLREAQMTEQQRLEAAVKSLEPVAAKSKALEEDVAFFLQTEEAAIPDDKKSLLELAPPADNPGARLRWIAQAKAKGIFGASAATAAATTTTTTAAPRIGATTSAPNGPAAPAPAGSQTPQQQYDALKAAGKTFAAAAFYAAHRPQIAKK
jgi:hypothetical protein